MASETITINKRSDELDVKSQRQQQRHKQKQRIMCRCCLSEHDENEYLALDTLAAVSYQDSECSTAPDSGDSSTTLLDCLNGCARICATLTDTALPQHICLDCCQTLEACCEFIRCVRNADKILRQKILHNDLNDVKDVDNDVEKTKAAFEEATPVNGTPIGNDTAAVPSFVEHTVSSSFSDYNVPAVRQCVLEINDNGISLNFEHLQQLLLQQTAQPLIDIQPDVAQNQQQIVPNFAELNADDAKSSQANTPTDDMEIENYFVRSFDSGIEIDDDFMLQQQTTTSSSSSNKPYEVLQYKAETFVVPAAIAAELQQFHKTSLLNVQTQRCGFCVFQCTNSIEFNEHLAKHLGAANYHCHLCKFNCHFQYMLAKHMHSVHQIQQDDSSGGINSTSSATKCRCNCQGHCPQHLQMHKVVQACYQCPKCAFIDSTRAQILEHLAKDHALFVDLALIEHYIPLQNSNQSHNNEFKQKDFKQRNCTVAQHKHKKHLCQFCGKSFDRRLHLLKHEYRIHQKSIETEQLKSKILKQNNTKYTQLQYTRQRKAAQAQSCADNATKVGDTLATQAGDAATTSIRCDICLATFVFNFELKYHMRTHKIATQTTIPTQPKIIAASADLRTATKQFEMIKVSGSCEDKRESPRIATSLPATPAATAKSMYATLSSANQQKQQQQQQQQQQLQLFQQTQVQMQPIFDETPLLSLACSLSSFASPSSSDHNFDINFDDQLYLNDFDLDLLNFGHEFF